ncbi:hypothetical protein GLOIN_2v1666139 [Rhizophagus irregularis DAOM 181602=DAOM 197198]|uniref:Uncharacterized protein n=1 Tax=Rhizophagus irregularis (strain DAOM 181602 / DAOM 197198 / MUCL 43194) TaxID=747089 RepID=A0A2P4PJA4_RHIID|nr:hypothetical protein GLOIN_2v1666139 [Rhizophagus irregularis DAOM 181602=DAOM 197198]POG65472.1 hypothetical protein GLOIN_2v1666139 [Rhizophagus irregularis DAOM 181602=DAOM 197198]|eukprot:XP_025172338.1 hypothetical protein GLOIN_2v1666139 [Rhizophagus irregularis DAOM 181602=DAOM 197198]
MRREKNLYEQTLIDTLNWLYFLYYTLVFLWIHLVSFIHFLPIISFLRLILFFFLLLSLS